MTAPIVTLVLPLRGEKTEAQSSYMDKVILVEVAELGTNTDPKAHGLPLRDKGGVWRENLGDLCIWLGK